VSFHHHPHFLQQDCVLQELKGAFKSFSEDERRILAFRER